MKPQSATATRTKHRIARLAVLAATLGATSGAMLAFAPPPAGASARPTVKLVSHARLGKILVNGAGRTVYIFTADSANKSACTGGCATVWPPVTVAKGAKPKGGAGVKGLGTIADGRKLQVTWNKHPLYTYALDSGPGVVNGNGVKQGSGVWYAASKAKVKLAVAPAKSSSGGSAGYGY